MNSAKKNYIGLAITTHDPAICILNSEGEIVFAQASERYLQNKRAWHSPADDLFFVKKLIQEYCDPENELIIALSWEKKFIKKVRRFVNFSHFNLIHILYEKILGYNPTLSTFFREIRVDSCLNELAGINLEYQYYKHTEQSVSYRYFDHHLTHAAAGCYNSIFEEALCAVIDGGGQKSSTAFFQYQSGKINRLPSKRSQAGNLGLFYELVCGACGFDSKQGEEWKVMGLAAYGQLDEQYYTLLKKCFKIKGLDIKVSKDTFFTIYKCLKMRKAKTNSAMEYANFAFTAQTVFSEYMSQLLTNLYETNHCENLVLGGGCALNSSYVGTILEKTPFKNVYVFSAPADDGNAAGAALLAFHQNNPHQQRTALQSPYLGSSMSEKSLQHMSQYSHLNMQTHSMEEIIEISAKLLSEGKIIGWAQDRAEFGPRALGNRSILADPRNAQVKEKLNAQVKFREEFRPFAPSILHEFGNDYFENYQESPYMERTLLFKQDVRHKVPGVVHVDGTGRLQTVKREWNQKYYDLIKAFYNITGVPILLNTSFNVMGKPIIHSVEDALAVFFTSGLDVLVLENNIIYK